MAGQMTTAQGESFGGPEVLVSARRDVPQAGPGQVLVKVMAAGVNPVETYMRAGTYARLPELPFVLGNDGAGVVEAVGPGESPAAFAVGDRVYLSGSLSGTYAQYCLCDASQVHVLPDPLSFEQGAAVGIAYRTAYRALFQRAHAKPGQTVFVHGASGGVGLAAVQLCRMSGIRVIGSAGTPEGMEAVSAQGAFSAVNHRTGEYLQQVLDGTGGNGVDVIVEMLANVNLGKDLKILARGGVVAVVGNRGTVEINPRDLMQKEASIVGVLGGTPAEHAEAFSAISAGLATGALQPVVGVTFPLDRAAAAHVEVMDHAESKAGKVVLLPWGSK